MCPKLKIWNGTIGFTPQFMIGIKINPDWSKKTHNSWQKQTWLTSSTHQVWKLYSATGGPGCLKCQEHAKETAFTHYTLHKSGALAIWKSV